MPTRSASLATAAFLATLALSSCRDSTGAHPAAAVDPPPVLTVTSPAPNEYLTRGEVNVEASCADDEPCVMEVRMDGEVVATATDRLSTTLHIPDGRQAQFEVRAAGAAPDQAFRWTMAAEASRRLLLPAILSDSPSVFIWDLDAHRYLTRSQIVDRATGARSNHGLTPRHLSPRGMLGEKCRIFPDPQFHALTHHLCEMWEWGPKGLVRLSGEYDGRTGGFPRWREPWLMVGDAVWNLRTEERVAMPEYLGGGDVGANGDVVWSKLDGIYRWRSGQVTRLTTSGHGPATDGSLVVYYEYEQGSYRRRLMLRTEAGNVVALTPGGMTSLFRDDDYRVRDGWVAFLSGSGDSPRELWTRSPAGELRRVATFQLFASLGEMGPDGAVIVYDDGRIYGVRPGGALVKIGSRSYVSGVGRVSPIIRWVDGVAYALLQNQIFRINF